MKQAIVFTLLTALLFACSPAEKNGSPSKNVTEPAVDGERIYKNYCVTCHGIAGDMGGSGAFDLTVSMLTVEQKVEVITHGRNAMTPFKDILSEEKIRAVAEYTMKLKK
jgi:mono/diheme cytochrome c family protein